RYTRFAVRSRGHRAVTPRGRQSLGAPTGPRTRNPDAALRARSRRTPHPGRSRPALQPHPRTNPTTPGSSHVKTAPPRTQHTAHDVTTAAVSFGDGCGVLIGAGAER